ncbi:hypothetical protein PENSUB_3089 [Penicillium subrubescens]|uniref:Uncharacterized protein n=1 Tax=Penicillium subrubescens TaxID=1316194 RepID=A0A1Q5UFZ2_9EURO|nr:hypothetical protein PENSUB_3089 [Penicillium subrubescens]
MLIQESCPPLLEDRIEGQTDIGFQPKPGPTLAPKLSESLEQENNTKDRL